jgi:hypothetical protein
MKIKELWKALRGISHSSAIRKRSADWTEKFSIAALAIGLFQADAPIVGAAGIILATIAGAISFGLTLKLEKEGR